MTNNTNKESGSILVLSLWILSILSLMASSLSFYAMIQMKVARFHLDQIQGRYLAQAGAYWSINVLIKEDNQNYQTLSQKWSNDPGTFKEKSFGGGSFSIQHVVESEEDSQVIYGITDAEQKININLAPKEILMQLPDITEEIADAMIDWRDTNPHRERRGAESDYYEDLDIPYPAKDGPLEDLEELHLVRDITPLLFDKWQKLLTIYGNGKVNINTASNAVLQILGLDDNLIEKITSFRRGMDGEMGNEDDGFFKDEGSIARALFEVEPLNSIEVSKIINLVSKGLLGVQSKHFVIESIGIPSGTSKHVHKTIVVVEHVQGDEIKIKRWFEK